MDPLCAIDGTRLPRCPAAATSQREPHWCDPTLRRASRQRPVPSHPAVLSNVSYCPALYSKRRGLRCSCRSMTVKSVQQSPPASTVPPAPPARPLPWVVSLPAPSPGPAEDPRSDELPMPADREHVRWTARAIASWRIALPAQTRSGTAIPSSLYKPHSWQRCRYLTTVDPCRALVLVVYDACRIAAGTFAASRIAPASDRIVEDRSAALWQGAAVRSAASPRGFQLMEASSVGQREGRSLATLRPFRSTGMRVGGTRGTHWLCCLARAGGCADINSPTWT